MKNLITRAAIAAAMAIGMAGAANAATFTLSNTNGGDGFVTAIPGGFDLFGADNGVGATSTTYLAVAPVAETITYNWTYTTNDCCGSLWDPAGYVINDVFTQLSVDINGNPGQGDASGVVTLNVGAGQDYGFYVNSVDSILGRGDIAVTSVPEPASWALMMVGVGALGFALRRSRAKLLAA